MDQGIAIIIGALIGGFCLIFAAVFAEMISKWLQENFFPWLRRVLGWEEKIPPGEIDKAKGCVLQLRVGFFILAIAFFGISFLFWLTAPVLALDVRSFYFPSGKVGDIGDVTFGTEKFTYEPLGIGPHEYDGKYNEDGSLNPNPAAFAGMCWLNPAGNWGTMPGGGKDLSDYNRIHWEARSLGEPVNVEFFIGGVTWIWGKDDDGKPKIVEPPYPGVPKYGLGTHKLTSTWQEFDVPLRVQKKEDLARVICGFGWVASWGNNDVHLDENGKGPVEKKKFEFEIKNIRYERGD